MSNSIPKDWKKQISQFKTELVAKYGNKWNSKAKSTDFHWSIGKPIAMRKAIQSNLRAEIIKAINRPMSIKEAKSLLKEGDYMRVFVVIRTNDTDGSDGVNKLTLPIRSLSDQVKLDRLMTLTKESLSPNNAFKRASTIESIKGWVRTLTKWMADSSTRQRWYVDTNATKAFIIPKNAPVAGPAYDHPTSNCAIEVIAKALGTVDDKTAKKLNALRKQFKHEGVWPDDYSIIATMLGCQIKTTYAPCTSIARQWVESGSKSSDDIYKSYGCAKKKTISIHHWNNHATAMADTSPKTYKYATEVEMVDAITTRFDSIYQIGDNHTAFRSDLDGSIEVLQLAEVDGVPLDLGVTSPQIQLFDEYASQIVPFGYNSPNIAAYDSFVKHGIHWSNGKEKDNDYDFDIANAYSSYDKMPAYRGLPQDITFWTKSVTINTIKRKTGFVLTTFLDPIKGIEITQWISCPAVEFLHSIGLIRELHEAAYAHNTFELDTSAFIQPGVIGKRVPHKIIGLSTLTTSKRTFISKDFIELSCHFTSSFKLPKHLADNYPALVTMAEQYSMINVSYPSTEDRISHVGASIQDYITLEVWRKWVEIRTLNPRAQVVTSLVDGFRVSKNGFDLSTFKSDAERWVRKPLKATNSSSQCDWVQIVPHATIIADDLITIDYPIELQPKFESLIDSNYNFTGISFAQLAREGWIHSIQGYAGSGKSWNIRKLLEQSHAIVLTPTHSTREDMSKHSIRKYLEESDLQPVPCRTFQSVIQRPGILNDYQMIIIDEAGMLLASDLNRLAEVAGRKLIILVGDPAQHSPITFAPFHLEAKYLVFKTYIQSNEELANIYNKGSDWDRNQMLNKITYDCDFVAPEIDDIDSDQFEDITDFNDRTELLRFDYKTMKSALVGRLRSVLSVVFDYTLDKDVPAFDTYSGGLFLEDIKRVDHTADGKALAEFSNAVRNDSMNAVYQLCSENPSYLVYPGSAEITSDITNTVIAYRNCEVNDYNERFRETLLDLSDRKKSETLQAELTRMIEHGTETQQEFANAQMPYAYVDVDIAIVARKTMRFVSADGTKMVIYNGDRGIIRNFLIYWDGYKSFPITYASIVESKPTEENPTPQDKIKVANIDPLYAITSYRAQGRTMGDGLIYIDCRYYSCEMLYVAVSRAQRMSQLRFIYDPKELCFERKRKSNNSRCQTKWGKQLGFIPTNQPTLLSTTNHYKLDALRYNWTNVDWFQLIDTIDSQYAPASREWFQGAAQIVNEFIDSNLSTRADRRYRYHDHVHAEYTTDEEPPMHTSEWWADTLKMFAELHTTIHVDDSSSSADVETKQWSQADTYWFNGLKQSFPRICSGPHFNMQRPSKVSIGHDVITFDFCVRVEHNGLRAFYWFVGSDDLLMFNKQYTTKYNNIECHEIIVERSCGYFIDLDYKLSNADLSQNFGSIEAANKQVALLLNSSIDEAAHELGWASGLQLCVSERSRQLDLEYTKISLHIYTNLESTFSECQLMTTTIKRLSTDKFSWAADMLAGIDYAPYHLNGSLAMPGGYKNGIKSKMLLGSYSPLLSVCAPIERTMQDDVECESDDECDSDETYNGLSDDETFLDSDDDEYVMSYKPKPKTKSVAMADLLASIDQCEYFSPAQMYKELSWTSADGNVGLIARKAAGRCGCCGGTHTQDNTLRVFITKADRFGAVCTRGGSPTYWN